MSVESDLKKDGIVVIKKLDTLRVNTIAKNVATRLCETFHLCITSIFCYTTMQTKENIKMIYL